jgi:hypothetical protein
MSGYRAKRMKLDEWTQFARDFHDYFMRSGADRRLALFLEWQHPGENPLVLIPDYRSSAIEGLSPSGWHALPGAVDRHWTMLVGNQTAIADFGLNLADPT